MHRGKPARDLDRNLRAIRRADGSIRDLDHIRQRVPR